MSAVAPVAPAWLRVPGRPAARRWLDLHVTGAGHVPAAGPVLLAATHTSHADTIALGAATPRRLTFLGSEHLPRVLQPLGMLPVRRGTGDREALRRCLEALAAGAALVVYPEGGRARDGRVYRPRSGVARLAAASGCPVVPVGIVGTAALWPADARPRISGGPVTVAFGPPLFITSPLPGARRAFNDMLHDALVALSGRPKADHLLPPAS